MLLQFDSTPQHSIPFPQALTDKYRPTKIDDFAGLEKQKRILKGLAARPYSSNWLFSGPSGTGKTTMGMALANEIGAEIHHVPSQLCTLSNIQEIHRQCHYVPMAGYRFHMVLVDEADRASDAAQIALLSYLDSTDPAPETLWVFTCNDPSRLEPRFLSRCRHLEFSSYGIGPAATSLLESIWSKETESPAPNFGRIVKESNNNVRAALMTLETELLAS